MQVNKELIGKIVCATWLDATETEVDIKQLKEKDVNDFLAETKTYGEVKKISRQGVVIGFSVSIHNFDIITIPSGMLKKIEILK